MNRARHSTVEDSPSQRLKLMVGLSIAIIAGAIGLYLWTTRSMANTPDPTSQVLEAPESVAGPIQLNPEQTAALGIQVEPAQATETVPLTGLPAESLAPMDASTRVIVPYAGVATRLLIDEGAFVVQGQPMLRIQSREWLNARAVWATARHEAHTATQAAQREAQLLAEGIIPAARYETTRLRMATSQDTLRQAEGTMAHLRAADNGQSGEYEILAPVSGRVLRRDVASGETVDTLQGAFVIAESDALDILFTVPMRTDQSLTTGLPVRLPQGEIASVVAVGASTDPASQRLRLRARLDDSAAYVAGQQFDVTLLLPAPEGAVSVPVAALLPQPNASATLYVREAGTYRAIQVARIGGDDTSAIVKGEGLQPGTEVVTRGTVALKSLIPLE